MLPQALHARRPYHLDDMQRARQRNPSNSSVKAKQTLDFSKGNKAVWSAMLEVLLSLQSIICPCQNSVMQLQGTRIILLRVLELY
jgi:cell division protein FtsL